MNRALSIIATKDPVSSLISLFQVEPSKYRSVINSYDKGCTAYIEGIADLDNAHFMTKWEMQDLNEKLSGTAIRLPPRDRLVAAKALAETLRATYKALPIAEAKVETGKVVRVRLPQKTIVPCKAGTKLATLVGLLLKGTTVAEMMEAIDQEEGGVLSSISWDLCNRKGFGTRISEVNGKKIWTLLLPQGFNGRLIA